MKTQKGFMQISRLNTNVPFSWLIGFIFLMLFATVWLIHDRISPTISDISVSDVTLRSAAITWNTNEITKTVFYLGTDNTYNLWQKSFDKWEKSHEIKITSFPSGEALQPGSIYYFKIEAIDKAGNKAVSQDQTFTTLEKVKEEVGAKEAKEGPGKPQSQSQPESKTDLCIGITCPACQYCIDGNCVVRIDGYNGCGSGCQRCVKGSCQDYNAVCSSCQYCSSDNCTNYCQGTDTNCGGTVCINCNGLDGWFDLGISYSCCDENRACACQKQEYRNYSCFGTDCTYLATETKVNKNSCLECGSTKICSQGTCRDTYSTYFYSSIIIGGFVHELYFSLSNNSSQTIRVTKVEFLNESGEIVKTISTDEIESELKAGYSTYESLGFRIPYSYEEIEKWQIKWYCVDFNNSPFTVSGSHEKPPGVF